MAVRVGHHGLGVVEPGDAGSKEKAQDVAFLLKVLGLECRGLLAPTLCEVVREGLVGVDQAVAVGAVRQAHRVGRIAEVVLDDPLVDNALAELGNPVGGAHGGVLETEEKGETGRLEPGNEVRDIHLDRDRRARVVHGEEVPEVLDPGVTGHVDLFA